MTRPVRVVELGSHLSQAGSAGGISLQGLLKHNGNVRGWRRLHSGYISGSIMHMWKWKQSVAISVRVEESFGEMPVQGARLKNSRWKPKCHPRRGQSTKFRLWFYSGGAVPRVLLCSSPVQCSPFFPH